MYDYEKIVSNEINFCQQPGIDTEQFHQISQKERVRLMLISDTHGYAGAAQAAIEQFPQTDLILHLGDHAADYRRLATILGKPMLAVRGNCDGFDSELPPIQTLHLAGMNFMMLHGHNYGFSVKKGLTKLKKFVVQHAIDIDYIFFGHTHIFHYEKVESGAHSYHYLNPGSCSYSLNAVYLEVMAGQIEDSVRIKEKY